MISKLVIAGIAISLMSFTIPKSWYLLESEKFSYKIEFPKKPVESPQVVNSAIGELKMNIYLYDASESRDNDENMAYMVNCTEYPESIVSSEKTEMLDNFFRSAIDGAVNNVQGKLLSEKVISIDNYPGREIRVDFKDGMAIITMRLYLVKNKMYMIQTITETKNDFNKSTSRFMDSFELLK